MMAPVQTVWAAVAFVLLMLYLLLIGRIVVDITRSFARSWRPEGVTAVGLELMYSRPIRRYVCCGGSSRHCGSGRSAWTSASSCC
jgi:hypothetical protein